MNESSVSRTVHPPLKLERKKQIVDKGLLLHENELNYLMIKSIYTKNKYSRNARILHQSIVERKQGDL